MTSSAPLVRPFAARIVKQDWADQVVSPMHDALPAAARASALADQPLSFLNVTRSSHDLPDLTIEELGQANAEALQRLLDAGAYDDAGAPHLYVYRVEGAHQEHVGIVAEVDLHGFADGRVLGHEAVQPARVDALVSHFDAVPARSELVALTHRKDAVVADVMARSQQNTPMLSVTDLTGCVQTVWRVSDEDIPRIVQALGDLPLFIADGHHRVAASVRRWAARGRPDGQGVLCVLYPEEQLHLLAFHRRVIGPVDAAQLLQAGVIELEVSKVDGPHRAVGELGLYVDEQWYALRPHDPKHRLGVAGLDVTTLNDVILRPLLGEEMSGVEYVSELVDLDEVTAACDADAGALFLLAAPSMDQLVEVAERREVMAPKSTYFEPKPRAGIFLRLPG